ncbi:hypothetical protein GIB67_004340 [Kingdonia uniflora]|uniref:Uncharacterized protein n=1 Tax=Kingdonia uniflora TaxID=39325 RepID=A0A7J7MRJ2_9MAGN|nr:hypothetical protein GIB67_004340 [Kingdonia uniflora]
MSLSQTGQIYPNPELLRPSHSKGSFGPVFIVLAVIVVISAIACFLGRFCARKFSHPKERGNDGLRPKESDIEFGSKERFPTAKFAPSGENKPATYHGFHPRDSEIEFASKERFPVPKFAHNGENKPVTYHGFHPKEGDIEFGFRERYPTANPSHNAENKPAANNKFQPKKDDIEFGFKERNPTAKLTSNEESKPSTNAQIRREINPRAHGEAYKASAFEKK